MKNLRKLVEQIVDPMLRQQFLVELSIMENNNYYRLRIKRTGSILGFFVNSNLTEDFCNEYTVTLQPNMDTPWVCFDLQQVSYVINHSTEWYNSSFEFPQHKFKAEELEIIDSTGSIVEPVKIPNDVEFYELKYKLTGDKNLIQIIDELRKRPNSYTYLYQDYIMILKEVEQKGIKI